MEICTLYNMIYLMVKIFQFEDTNIIKKNNKIILMLQATEKNL